MVSDTHINCPDGVEIAYRIRIKFMLSRGGYYLLIFLFYLKYDIAKKGDVSLKLDLILLLNIFAEKQL